MIISYLGPAKSYSENAAIDIANSYDDAKLEQAPTIEFVAKNVAERKAELGVIPHYNYLQGLVQASLDAIYENDLAIVASYRLPIVLTIAQHPENTDQTIYSKQEALAQCSEWLWENYPNSRLVPTSSTSAAAQKVSKEKAGLAIGSIDAMVEANLDIVADDIGTRKHGIQNFTEFYVVASEKSTSYDKTNYKTMIAITPPIDRVGLLRDVLDIFSSHNLNSTKIHSRPAQEYVELDDNEAQMFYLEVKGHEKNSNVQSALSSLQTFLQAPDSFNPVSVLGSYAQLN